MAFAKMKNYIITIISAFFILLCFSGLTVNAEDEPSVVPYNIEVDIENGNGGSVKVWKDSTDFQICSSGNTNVTVLNDVINFDILPDSNYEIESVVYEVGVDYRTMSSSNVNGVVRYTLDNTNKETKSGVLKVKFSPIYTISVSDDDDTSMGKVSISGADREGVLKVKDGETVRYTVTAPVGYQIDNITVGNETTTYFGNTETVSDIFIATSDIEISAEFSKKRFNLSFGYKSGQDTIGTTKVIYKGIEYSVGDSPISVEYGDEVEFSTVITDSQTLYVFSQYNCDVGSFDDNTDSIAKYTVGDSDSSNIYIETEFVNEYIKVSFDIGKNGSISYSGVAGTVTVNSDDKTSYRAVNDFKFKVSPASSLYSVGSVVYIPDATGIAETVKASGGYYVVSKSLGSGTLRVIFVDASSYEVVVEEPSEKNCYMTVKADGVKLSPGVNRVSADSTITVSAYTDEGSGYIFDYISVNGTAKTASDTYKISYLDEDIKIAALFEKVETYKITINNKGNYDGAFLIKFNSSKDAVSSKFEEKSKENEIADGEALFDDEAIEKYFEENYGKVTTGLFIPFTSALNAEALMESVGINYDASLSTDSSSQLAGWLKADYDEKNNKAPKVNRILNCKSLFLRLNICFTVANILNHLCFST